MQGQGARFILMQEGVLNWLLPGVGLPVFGVNQAALRAHAKMKPCSKHNPHPSTWAAQALHDFEGAGLIKSEDQAVAAYAAHWLICHAEKA